MTLKTAIVILNWNGKKYLNDFLPTLLKYLPQSAGVFVADNNSSDDSIDFIEKNFSSIELIKLKENFGYAQGYNEALRQIDAKYYILLNSDIEVTENWIEPIIEFFEQNENVAACQPKIKSWHQPEYFEYAGAGGGFIDFLGYPFCRGRIFQEMEKDFGQYNDTIEVFWASGACMFVRADVFHKLNGFDEDFFAHMEEIDFCWRAKNMDYKVVYHPASTVYHIGGGTLPKSNPMKTYLNFRNNFCLLYKNLPQKKLFIVFFYRLLLDGIAAFKFLLDGGFKDFVAVMKAHFYFYRNWSKLKRKRKMLTQKQVSGIYLKNIALNHFVGGVKRFDELNSEKFSK
jgi:GT2 family glycosyltransferase